ncbi:hypothetical protein A2477_04750 [Candidatus Falkowbacteria bacterium RIFOXYC2_FULL_47_12]|uniref:NYN domain-containing protein n=1 Tax=Candidatus Falkowbacteria bacterium RIFOXYC2_FULL_47_12 TaxID=1798004 RepID=A0A1F5TNX8_9BACT|nr:MAG: hypothetical protein A2477_04750 [Candidatus Falkowbacteria bacterium RIFOXYC2_FULL_47_12]
MSNQILNLNIKDIGWQQWGRIVVFIDVANVVYSLRDLGWRMDYKKLQSYFQTQAKLVDIYFYYSTQKDNNGQANLLAMLARRGFRLAVKEVKIITIGKNEVMYKGNCDVELTIDMIDIMPAYDTAVLLSGDSDFAPLVKYVQRRGKRVIVVSTRGHIGRELIQAADRFIWFNWFKNIWNFEA